MGHPVGFRHLQIGHCFAGLRALIPSFSLVQVCVGRRWYRTVDCRLQEAFRTVPPSPTLSSSSTELNSSPRSSSTMSASPTGLSYIWSLLFNERDKRSSLFIFQRGPACNRLSSGFGGPGSAAPRRRPTHSSLSVFAHCFSSQRYQAQDSPLFSGLRRQSPISREIAPCSLGSLSTAPSHALFPVCVRSLLFKSAISGTGLAAFLGSPEAEPHFQRNCSVLS